MVLIINKKGFWTQTDLAISTGPKYVKFLEVTKPQFLHLYNEVTMYSSTDLCET